MTNKAKNTNVNRNAIMSIIPMMMERLKCKMLLISGKNNNNIKPNEADIPCILEEMDFSFLFSFTLKIPDMIPAPIEKVRSIISSNTESGKLVLLSILNRVIDVILNNIPSHINQVL